MSDQDTSESTQGKPGTVGGGRSTRGPEPDPGGDAETPLVPPYDDRSAGRGSSESSEALTESIERQMETTDPGNVGATASPAHESPDEASSGAAGSDDRTATASEPSTPHGVGESTTRRGEDIADQEGKEPGRVDTGVDDTPAQRPHGTSTGRDMTGVDPQEPQQ